MTLTRRNFLDFLIISLGVALAFLINSQVNAISPLFLSLLFGLAISNTVGWQERRIQDFSAKRLLRLGVIFLGFQISFDQFSEIGIDGVIVTVAIVFSVFFAIKFAAAKLGMRGYLPIFVAAGFAICGATAIAALSSTLLRESSTEERKSAERDISYAIGIVALCGTLSIFILPGLASLLGLSDALSGAWIGASVHDVGQVVATASLVGGSALEPAILVKLTRVVMLIPLILLAVQLKQNQDAINKEAMQERLMIRNFPLFVLFFVIVAVLVNLVSLDSSFIDIGKETSKVFLAYGLFGMGLSVRWKSISTLGSKPILVGLSLWVLSACFALAMVSLVF